MQKDWPNDIKSLYKTGTFNFTSFSSVTQSCPTLCDPMNRSTPVLPVHHHLPEFTETDFHRVGDAIQPSHPLSSPSPPAPSPSQYHPSLNVQNKSSDKLHTEELKTLEFFWRQQREDEIKFLRNAKQVCKIILRYRILFRISNISKESNRLRTLLD